MPYSLLAVNLHLSISTFVDAMRELGWVEGRNIVYDRVYADGDEKRLPALGRLPVVGHRSEFADDGALMSYSSLLTDQIRRSAYMVDKILKGTRPADIPVELPTKFALVVNARTAKALGITIPGKILLQASRVIE